MNRVADFRRQVRRALAGYQLWATVLSHSKSKPAASRKLGIGPKNTAGQAHAWARAVSTHVTGLHAESFGITRDSVIDFPSDRSVSRGEWYSRPWQVKHASYVLSHYSHLLIESGASVFGNLLSGSFEGDLPYLRKAGIRTGLVFHGSDIRNPDHHASTEEFSPFRLTRQDEHTDPAWCDLVATLREKTVDLRQRLDAHATSIPKFVSTPGLLEYVPDAQWLPIVIDIPEQPKLTSTPNSPPIVVHLPTNERMKGTRFIDPVCERLDAEGLVQYLRPGLMRPKEAAELLRQSFCVIDAIGTGNGPSVTACQAMAAGVPVVGHISDSVRERIPIGLPIVEAKPDTLEQVIRRLVSDPEEVDRLSVAGRSYVERLHSGRYSAEILRGFLEADGESSYLLKETGREVNLDEGYK